MTVNVAELIDTVPPTTIDVVPMLIAAPDVPTVASQSAVVPSLLKMRANVAVPLAAAVPDVMALAVSTPAEGDPNAGFPNVSVASSVLPESAVFAFAGCVPE